MTLKGVLILNSSLINGKTLARVRLGFTSDIEFDTAIGDAKELEDTFVMRDPRNEGYPFSAEEDIELVRWDVIECYGVWLNSTLPSSQI